MPGMLSRGCRREGAHLMWRRDGASPAWGKSRDDVGHNRLRDVRGLERFRGHHCASFLHGRLGFPAIASVQGEMQQHRRVQEGGVGGIGQDGGLHEEASALLNPFCNEARWTNQLVVVKVARQK